MKQLIILCGAGASGKDYFSNYLINHNYVKAKDYTTRLKRNNDDNYFFVNKIPVKDCYYIFQVNGKNWLYGYSKKELLNTDFCILPPLALSAAIDYLKINKRKYKLIYFNINKKIRKQRLLQRNDNDAIRRLKTDADDFKDFIKIYKPNLIITNEKYYSKDIINIIKN